MPVDRALLDQQLAGIPNSAAWAKRPEVDHMATVMTGGEQLLAGATGWLIESGKLAMRTWVVVATTQRLLCVLKGGPQGFKQVEVPIATMKSAYTDARLGYHEVIVESDKAKLVLSGMPKEAAVSLAGALNQAVGLKNKVAQKPAAPAAVTTYGVPPATTALAEAATLTPLPMLDDIGNAASSGESIDAYIQQVKKLAAELENTKKRLAAVEDVIRRAAARSAAAKTAGK